MEILNDLCFGRSNEKWLLRKFTKAKILSISKQCLLGIFYWCTEYSGVFKFCGWMFVYTRANNHFLCSIILNYALWNEYVCIMSVWITLKPAISYYIFYFFVFWGCIYTSAVSHRYGLGENSWHGRFLSCWINTNYNVTATRQYVVSLQFYFLKQTMKRQVLYSECKTFTWICKHRHFKIR